MKFEIISEEQWKSDVKYAANKVEVYNDIVVPTRKTSRSAGYDFYAPYDFTLLPGSKTVIPTGIKVELDSDKVLFIAPRSSIGIKYNITMCNTIGIIDSDYYNNIDNEGHIFIAIKNNGNKDFHCKKGDRFAQGVILSFFTTEDDNTTKVRTGGIGSTGV